MAQHRPKGRKPDHRKDALTYLAYRKAEVTVEKVAEQAGLSRSGLYKLVNRVETRHQLWTVYDANVLEEEVLRLYPDKQQTSSR